MARKKNKPKRKIKSKKSRETASQKIESHFHSFNTAIWILFLMAMGTLAFAGSTVWQALELKTSEAEASFESYNNAGIMPVEPESSQVEAASFYSEPYAFSANVSNEQNSLQYAAAPEVNYNGSFMLNNNPATKTIVSQAKKVKAAPVRQRSCNNDDKPQKSETKGKHVDEDCCPDPDEWPKPGCVYNAKDYSIMLKGSPAKKK